jgi:flavin reductase (DIM6/NTAB) family NADH-FMN oxidoreductase RutF
VAEKSIPEPSIAGQREFSGNEFRSTLGAFATGVTVVTTHGEADTYGMTANAFSSVSLDPPLVLVCVISGTRGAQTIEQNGVFAVNILRDDQEPISRYFASRDRPFGRAGFAEVAHTTAVTGSPVLSGAGGFLDCLLVAAHEAGDHVIYIGEVVALGFESEFSPLLFHHGRYKLLRDDA